MGHEARTRKAKKASDCTTQEGLAEFLNGFVEVTFRKMGEVMPMFVAVKPDGEQMVITTPWRDEADKIAILRTLRDMFRANGVVRYGMVSEVWLAGYGVNEMPRGGPVLMPSERHDKTEAVIIIVVEPGKPPVFASREIKRPWDGTSPHLAPPDKAMRQGFEGRMLGLLDV